MTKPRFNKRPTVHQYAVLNTYSPYNKAQHSTQVLKACARASTHQAIVGIVAEHVLSEALLSASWGQCALEQEGVGGEGNVRARVVLSLVAGDVESSVGPVGKYQLRGGRRLLAIALVF